MRRTKPVSAGVPSYSPPRKYDCPLSPCPPFTLAGSPFTAVSSNTCYEDSSDSYPPLPQHQHQQPYPSTTATTTPSSTIAPPPSPASVYSTSRCRRHALRSGNRQKYHSTPHCSFANRKPMVALSEEEAARFGNSRCKMCKWDADIVPTRVDSSRSCQDDYRHSQTTTKTDSNNNNSTTYASNNILVDAAPDLMLLPDVDVLAASLSALSLLPSTLPDASATPATVTTTASDYEGKIRGEQGSGMVVRSVAAGKGSELFGEIEVEEVKLDDPGIGSNKIRFSEFASNNSPLRSPNTSPQLDPNPLPHISYTPAIDDSDTAVDLSSSPSQSRVQEAKLNFDDNSPPHPSIKDSTSYFKKITSSFRKRLLGV